MIPFWANKNWTVKDASKWKRPNARFDAELADKKVAFIERHCRHVKGELAGELFKLEEWERQIVRGIFGWIRPNGNRLYREVFIYVPKKNGKSSLGAAIGNTVLLTEREPGSEIYSVASETEQAAIIFSIAKDMIIQDPELQAVTQIFRRSIIYKDQTYQVLSADADTKEGKNSHVVLFDELHVQPGRDLYDNLKTGMAARRQPLMIMFTTAGYDRHSFCYEVYQKAIGVLRGSINDPTFLPILFGASIEQELEGGALDDIDWTNPKVWKRANPNYGVSVKVDFLREECEKAQQIPAYENTFKRKHLNVWTEQETRWLAMAEWDKCNGFDIVAADNAITWRRRALDALAGRRCYGGLDLASTQDLNAFVLVFTPQHPQFDEVEINGETVRVFIVDPIDPFIVVPYFWVPGENMRQRVKRDGVPYDTWIDQGFIETTPGRVTDYGRVMSGINTARAQFDLRALAFDRWGSQKIVADLVNSGFVESRAEAEKTGEPFLVQFAQTYGSFNSPTKELLNCVVSRKVVHGANPVLRWNASNVVVTDDGQENIKPDKRKSTERIDGIVAAIMGLDLAIRFGSREEESGYVFAV